MPLKPGRDLKGDWWEKATNISGIHTEGIHLVMPGYEDKLPTLEIFQYNKIKETREKLINKKGFTHIAFRVDDVEVILQNIIKHGGSQYGELAETEIEWVGTIVFVYAKDIDGNIIELQSWR